jgi:hypothetical protein
MAAAVPMVVPLTGVARTGRQVHWGIRQIENASWSDIHALFTRDAGSTCATWVKN